MPEDQSSAQAGAGLPAPVTGSFVPAVAVLIDGDNIAAGLAADILIEAGKLGGVTIRRVFGNWNRPATQAWQAVLEAYGLTAIPLPNLCGGKNAADIALTVAAMDLLHAGLRVFCIASGDSDYTPLVQRLRQEGGFVLGIGNATTSSQALRAACNRFMTTDDLPGSTSLGRRASAVETVARIEDGLDPPPLLTVASEYEAAMGLEQLLLAAWDRAMLTDNGGLEGRVLIQRFGQFIKQFDPQFAPKSYGSKTLTALLQSLPHLFELEMTSTGDYYVRKLIS